MKASKLIPVLSLLVPAVAFAQPDDLETTKGFDHPVTAVQNAVELGIAAGYAQGAGKLGGSMNSLEDVASAGGAVEVDAGARIQSRTSASACTARSRSRRAAIRSRRRRTCTARAPGVQGTWHFRPATSVDPFVNLGTGWRGLWLNPSSGKATALQGLELARLQLGVDYRVTPDVAIAPVIGGASTCSSARTRRCRPTTPRSRRRR